MSEYPALAERMAPACAESVDDMEVAAVLEADGITDAVAAALYGSPDVFHLATRLCRQNPRQPTRGAEQVDPWQARPGRPLLRGLLFGLPALCYLAAGGTTAGPAAGTVLVVSVLLSWATSQALAYLGHVRLGWGDRPGALRVLRGGLLWGGAPVLAVTIATGVAFSAPVPLILTAVGQVGYLLAATVLLVLDAELLLLAALAPGVVAALVGLAAGGGTVRSLPVAVAAASTVVATAVLALYRTRPATGPSSTGSSSTGSPATGPRVSLPTRAEVRGALPYALFGGCAGGLLLFVPVDNTLVPADLAAVGPPAAAGMAAGLVTMLPLSVSMGLAELLLSRYRSATFRALRHTATLPAFARRARRALLGTVAGYLLALVVATATAAALAASFGGVVVAPAAVAGYAALGGALFLALLLMSFQLRGPAVAGCATALAVECVAAGWLLTTARQPAAEEIQLGAATVLLTVLLTYALVALSAATAHR